MSPNSLRSECRKFAPNIFNKTKCTNCFKQKEEHTAEALECNRASRKIAKCGYLFVAPGWDFSIPLNRTKRWQRRWFVLYDDGELNYSVDEHPDTVPQASVDMTQVLEVASAEEVTGHMYSLAITAPDRVTFVKATCREDARWWTDVLSVFPRNKGRHKRNATFPGGQTTTIHQAQTITRSGTPNPIRPRYNSCHSDSILRGRPPLGWMPEPTSRQTPPLRDSPPPQSPPREVQPPPSSPPQPVPPPPIDNRTSYRDQPASSASPPTRDKLNSEEKARTRRSQLKLTHDWLDSKPSQDNNVTDHQRILSDYEQQYKRDEKLKDIAAVLTRPRLHNSTSSLVSSVPCSDIVHTPTRDSDSTDDEHRLSIDAKSPDSVDGITEKMVTSEIELSPQQYPSAELRVELPAEDLLNLKKGWLMQQAEVSEVWNKHWFVLCGSTLTAFRDPDAEDSSNADSVVNLNSIASITEVQVARNYGFQIKMWNDKTTVLSAVTAGIRANWMLAIKKAAGLDDLPPKPSLSKSVEEKLQKELASNLIQSIIEKEKDTPSTPVTPRSILFSSDEEYRTASEGGRRESGDWGDSLTALPPSPPLNRTPISRVKDRARSRSNSRSRLYKRSRSSPPSSRNSTLDSVSTEDLMRASCCGDVPESEIDEGRVPSTLTDSSIIEMLEAEVQSLREQLERAQIQAFKSNVRDTVEKQSLEIDELRKKLKNAVNDLNNSEQELIRLRKIKTESVLRERRTEELLATLERTEQQLNQRTQQVEDIEKLKDNFNKDREICEQKILESSKLYHETLEQYEILSNDYIKIQQDNSSLQEEINSLHDRLIRGIEEYDYLHKKLQQIEAKEIKERSSSYGSLSNLTNIDLELDADISKESLLDEYNNLKTRFEKAVHEIKAMKRELRESHIKFDDLELSNITLKQDIKRFEEDNQAQAALMAARIQDLTVKLTASEKQVRSLKSKLQDSREKRRSLSLKGRESFSINKEVEDKITELEAKILNLESDKSTTPVGRRLTKSSSKKSIKRDRSSERASPIEDKHLRRLRRKSLDSATSSEPMKVLIRLSSLESKIANIDETKPLKEENLATSCESLNVSTLELRPDSEAEVESNNNKVIALENIIKSALEKLNDSLLQVTILKQGRKSTLVSEKLEPLENSLIEICDILKKVNECIISPDEVNVISESVMSVVKSYELLLKSKLTELSNKRCTLRETGKLNEQTSMQILAEKLAYEAILIGRIHDALNRPENDNVYSNRIMKREIVETSQLMKVLKNKLNGSCIKKYFSSKISEDYLTRVLTRKLIQAGFVTNNNRSSLDLQSAKSSQDITKALEYLLSKQRDLNISLQKYKSTKLEQLAYSLAVETLNYASDTECRLERRSLDEAHVKEAWKHAQETVSTELIQSEISHVMMRCAQMYESNVSVNHASFFSFFASERAALELWSDTVEEKLRKEMDQSVEDLTNAYRNSLAKLKQQSSGIWRRRVEQERNANKSRLLLLEFADVIAHKALVDSRIAVLIGDGKQILNTTDYLQNIFVKNLIESDQYLSIMEDCGVLEPDHIMESEFQYLYQHYTKECEESISKLDVPNDTNFLKQVSQGLLLLERQLSKVQSCVNVEAECSSTGELKSWNDICIKCSELQNRLSKISLAIFDTKACKKCEQLRSSLNRLSREHEQQLAILRKDQERDMVSLRGELEHERASLVTQHKSEQAQLKERARLLEQRLGTLDSEYSQQLDNLRQAYRKTLSQGLEKEEGEENIRQRYQAEIEHLRNLCEKGLMAVENSHRRVVAELEDKHRREREQLYLEKEQALAEETQATLAALDAMRKAHESEVQREISKFKADFIRKMQATHDIGALHKEHEAEMKEIKQEILSLSERYSVKCVESASLEEQLEIVNRQLAQAQQHIQQLDSRNKQLRAHLVSEVGDTRFTTEESSSSSRQGRVNRRGSGGVDTCKPKISSIRNPQLSPLQN